MAKNREAKAYRATAHQIREFIETVLDEMSVVGSIAGYSLPLGMDPDPEAPAKKTQPPGWKDPLLDDDDE